MSWPTKRLVMVHWLDSSGFDGWQDDGNVPDLANCYSVGWVLKEDGQCIVLTGNMAIEEEQAHAAFAIPVAAIVEIFDLVFS